MAGKRGDEMKAYVIAIDLGTSRTAYSWKSLITRDDYYTVGVPDKKAGEDVIGKSPTALLVAGRESGRTDFEASHTHSFGHTAEQTFASGDGPFGAQLFSQFKMLMYSDPPLYATFADLCELKTLSTSNRSEKLEKILVLALRCIKDAVVERLSLLSAQEAIWVLTVPAVRCSGLVKTFIRYCAAKAGLIEGGHDDQALVLCLEPVAACLSMGSKLTWRMHETYLVVDCGGGTVDIASFRVVNAELEELSLVGAPTGGLWGGTNVDDAFYDFLKKFIFGAAAKTQSRADIERFMSSSLPMFRMKQAWESAKISVKDVDHNIYFDLAELCQAPLKISLEAMDRERRRTNQHQVLVSGEGTSNLILEPALVKGFFKPCCDRIAEAVMKQLDRPELGDLRAVVMVGGFSNSVHLKRRITNCVINKHPRKNVPVISPPRPDLAVVGGASHYGSSLWNQTPPAPRDVPPQQHTGARPPPYHVYEMRRSKGPVLNGTVATVSYGILTAGEGDGVRPTHFDTFIIAGQQYKFNNAVRHQYPVVAGGPPLRLHIGASSQRLFGLQRLDRIEVEKSEILEVVLPSLKPTRKVKKWGWKKKAKDQCVDVTVDLSLRGIDLHVRVFVGERGQLLLDKSIRFSGG